MHLADGGDCVLTANHVYHAEETGKPIKKILDVKLFNCQIILKKDYSPKYKLSL